MSFIEEEEEDEADQALHTTPATASDQYLATLAEIEFRANRITIVQLEAHTPLPRSFLEAAQRDLGDYTTHIGCLSWTKFRNWENALRYYLNNHMRDYHDNRMYAQPISVPDYTYEKLMTTYKDWAVDLQIKEIPHVSRWPTPSTH